MESRDSNTRKKIRKYRENCKLQAIFTSRKESVFAILFNQEENELLVGRKRQRLLRRYHVTRDNIATREIAPLSTDSNLLHSDNK